MLFGSFSSSLCRRFRQGKWCSWLTWAQSHLLTPSSPAGQQSVEQFVDLDLPESSDGGLKTSSSLEFQNLAQLALPFQASSLPSALGIGSAAARCQSPHPRPQHCCPSATHLHLIHLVPRATSANSSDYPVQPHLLAHWTEIIYFPIR